MNARIKQFVDEAFKPYEGTAIMNELKEEIMNDLQEKYADLVNDGLDAESAYRKTAASLGDITEIAEQIAEKREELSRRMNLNFSMNELEDAKLDSVDLKSGRFHFSSLANTDFTSSNLSGSSFKAANLEGVRFDGADLRDSVFKYCNLERCSFNSADLRGARFNKSNLEGVTFEDAKLDDVEFRHSELAGLSFDNLTIRGTAFEYSNLKKASFRNAVLERVSFNCDVRKAVFDGATMDKITYAFLKSKKADLGKVNLRE